MLVYQEKRRKLCGEELNMVPSSKYEKFKTETEKMQVEMSLLVDLSQITEFPLPLLKFVHCCRRESQIPAYLSKTNSVSGEKNNLLFEKYIYLGYFPRQTIVSSEHSSNMRGQKPHLDLMEPCRGLSLESCYDPTGTSQEPEKELILLEILGF